MFARYALLTSLAPALPCPWGRAEGTGGQHLQPHLDFCIFLSACMHEILSLISGLLSSFAIAFVKTYLSNIYGPNACTKPSGPDFLAPQLIDCSWKVKTTKVPPKLWDPEQLIRFHIQFFYSEQAELRGSVSGTGLAAALVSCGLQHHTPDCGKFRWALLSPIHFL